MRYGPGSSWKRHDDGGDPSSDTAYSREPGALAKRYGVNQKTVRKWKGRSSVADIRTGPTQPRSTVLSGEEEAIVVAFRRHTLLSLDDCLYALQPTIPHLTRSSLHRCLQRHGIGRLVDIEGDKPAKKRFKSYPIGFFHIDIAEVQTAASITLVAEEDSDRLALRGCVSPKKGDVNTAIIDPTGKIETLNCPNPTGDVTLNFGEQAGVVNPDGTSAIGDVAVGATGIEGALALAGIGAAIGIGGGLGLGGSPVLR